MDRIKIVHVPVGEEPRVVEIDDSLRAMQALVGGYIEHHGMGGGMALICNEDGVALNLPQNGCGILGPFFFVKTDDYGNSVSLTDAECNAIRAHVAMYRLVKHSGKSDIRVESFNSWEEMAAYLEARRRESSGEFN